MPIHLPLAMHDSESARFVCCDYLDDNLRCVAEPVMLTKEKVSTGSDQYPWLSLTRLPADAFE